MTALTPLILQNADVLRAIRAQANDQTFRTLKALAEAVGRDSSNLKKTLDALAEAELIFLERGPPLQTLIQPKGVAALDALARAEGRPEAALLTHSQIRPDPNNPRRTFDQVELEALAENIAERGLLQGLNVKIRADGEAVITAGERRWRAIGLLIAREDPRWPADRPVPHLVSQVEDQDEVLIDALIENIQRVDLHPLDEAAAFARLKDAGWSATRIAEALGNRTKRYVEQRLDLLNLSETQRRRMMLDDEDPEFLSIKGARNLLQHLRQIASGASEQRDIEEIAPTSPELAPSPASEDPLVVNGVRYPNLTRANQERDRLAGGSPSNSGGGARPAEVAPPVLSETERLAMLELSHKLGVAGVWVNDKLLTPVASYWLSADATRLSRELGLVQFQVFQTNWHVTVTPAAATWFVAESGSTGGFADEALDDAILAARARLDGWVDRAALRPYRTEWLNFEIGSIDQQASPPAASAPELAIDQGDEFEEAERIRQAGEVLMKVSEAVKTGLFGSQGSIEFRDLLVAVGIDGPLKIWDGDSAGGIFVGEDEIATIDPQRDQPDALALARAELIAFAVNAFAGHSKDAHL